MTRRVICLLALWLITVAAGAQRGQDFVSKFMQQYQGDTALHCVTVSPKMMEQLTRQPDANRNAHIAQAIEKLKSARIVTAHVRGEGYYKEAEELLKKNAQRFRHDKSYRTAHAYGAFYTRKDRSGDTVELIMLHTDTKARKLVIVNLTGDIDQEFVNALSKSLGGHTAKVWR